MNLHEYQGKKLFMDYGLPVTEGVAAMTVEEAVAAADIIGGDRWMVKVQVHAGGRVATHFEILLMLEYGNSAFKQETGQGNSWTWYANGTDIMADSMGISGSTGVQVNPYYPCSRNTSRNCTNGDIHWDEWDLTNDVGNTGRFLCVY